MMGQLTSRIAGSMAASQPKNGFLASAAEHLATGGGHKGSGFGGGAAKAAVDKAGTSIHTSRIRSTYGLTEVSTCVLLVANEKKQSS